MDQLVSLIREFGFPTFVVLWFMFRLEKRLDRLVELLGSLMQATALLAKSVETRNRFDQEADGPNSGNQLAAEERNQP